MCSKQCNLKKTIICYQVLISLVNIICLGPWKYNTSILGPMVIYMTSDKMLQKQIIISQLLLEGVSMISTWPPCLTYCMYSRSMTCICVGAGMPRSQPCTYVFGDEK